jgi:hypothetical protein
MHAGDSFKEKKVAAWRGDAQVSGKITDEAGKGIPEAKVSITSMSTRSVSTAAPLDHEACYFIVSSSKPCRRPRCPTDRSSEETTTCRGRLR